MFNRIHWRKLIEKTGGQTLGEYALLLLLVALVAIAAVTALGNRVTALLAQVGAAF